MKSSEYAFSGHVIHLAGREPIESVGDGITRQMLSHGPELMLCRVGFESGAQGTLHSHPHAQVSYVESGRFRISIDGITHELAKGDSCYVGPNLEHGASCIETGVIIDAFTPARLDFLSIGENS